MKNWLTIILMVCASICMAQNESESIKVMPKFPGGDNAFYDYLDEKVVVPSEFDKVKYLEEERNQYVPILVGFAIEKDGSISNVRVIDGAHEILDKKAKEIVEQMPKWEPGNIDGTPIQVQYAIPIRFNLM